MQLDRTVYTESQNTCLEAVRFTECSILLLLISCIEPKTGSARSLVPKHIDTDSRVCWEVGRRLVVRCPLHQWSSGEGGAFTHTHTCPDAGGFCLLMGAKGEIPHELQQDSPIAWLEAEENS